MTCFDDQPGVFDRFVFSPATRVLWRGPAAVQLELGDDAVVLDGVAPDIVRRLADASDAAREDGAGEGMPASAFTADALRVLAGAGFVRSCGGTEIAPAAPAPRLGADLLALTARHGPPAGAILAARRRRSVSIEGSSRVAAHVGALLAAAGVGRVYFQASADAQLQQAIPGGLTPSDEGRRFAESAGDAVRRAAPDVDLTPLPMGEYPDLVLLASDGPTDPDRRDALHAARCVHLPVQLGLDGGSVGPLVVPGVTSCLSCADLARRDRDPAWPALSIQLTVTPRRGHGSDVVLATVLGAIAAQQALAHLDGTGTDAVANGSLEVRAWDWQVRRRTRPPHPECDCGAARAAKSPAACVPEAAGVTPLFG